VAVVKSYPVRLSPGDREWLEGVVARGSHPVRMVDRAKVLLWLDESRGRAPSRPRVAARVGVTTNTVLNVARRLEELGGDVRAAVGRKKASRPPVEPKVTGDVEARLIMLACSDPPEGYDAWTLRLMERHVKLDGGLPDLDHSTIGRALKRGI
jgi:transposase